jgi:hypothetical protein
MDVFEYDFQHYPYSTLSDIIRQKSDIYPTLFIFTKNKVPIEAILKLSILLNTNYK